MSSLFFFFLTFSVCYVRNDTPTRDVESAIFKYRSITSFLECQIESIYFNNAQKLHIPLPKIPPEPITEKDVSFFIYSRQHPEPYEVNTKIPPEPITEKDVSFFIYSRQHPEPYEVNTYDTKKSIRSVSVDYKKRTVLYCHGIESTYKEFVPVFRDSLLPKEDINLILVNWESYAFFNPIYTRNNTTPRLGNILTKFLHQFIATGADPKNIYLIGMSSGAQAIGLGAKPIHPRIGRILGIDPVGTCYNFLPPHMRLTKGDADFVEIIHCSIGQRGELLSFLGDVTFYMNGGIIQPQCEMEETLQDINDCSHKACGPYAFETLVNFNKYIGVKCNTYSDYTRGKCNCGDTEAMGYNTTSEARGTYYVNTKPLPPLCP